MMTKLLRVGGSVLAVVLGVGMAQGQQAPDAAAGKTLLLWPGGAPGAQGTADVDQPTLTVYLPSGVNATKTGVVVAPGGGYQHLSMTKEGSDIAHWLNERGVAAFVLKYRLGPTYHNPIELGDAQRAIRMVRANAAEYGIAPDHLGMWGFSAGGHLTATTGTHFDAGNPSATDTIDRQSSRPDFLILAYPVITMLDPSVHSGSRKYLLGDTPDPALEQSMSAELQVTKDTPPTFLFATTDDGTVPVMNSVMFYSALVKAGVPAEMHLFQQGAHGAGLAVTNPQLSVWPDLLIKWMRERGYAAPAAVPSATTGN
ncbi:MULTISPECIES: alpha/beta hydrolase [Acidobacteriaceae]|uniref:alpha/beta hydrolase n=1 Tax=Acidobacteriaceae TaxID=204434 RepID=UPI00131DC3E7|nr:MULTISPECIES: alpha/beta hydrolase [Acidobacteriaceae]MDW5264373.1 alpha/beta hydrolase [Edaphobacter sp.]